MKHRFANRFRILLALVPVLFSCYLLINCVPLARHPRVGLSLDGELVFWELMCWGKEEAYALEMNGTLRKATKQELLKLMPIDGTDSLAMKHDGRIVRVNQRGMPVAQPSNYLGLSAAVALGQDWLVASTYQNTLRLIDPNSLQVVDEIGPFAYQVSISTIEGSNRLLCSHRIATGDCESLIVDVTGSKFQVVSKWKAGFSWGPARNLGRRIFTLRPLVTAAAAAPLFVENRDSLGNLIESFELPSAIRRCVPQVGISNDVLWAADSSRSTTHLFDLTKRRPIEISVNGLASMVRVDQERILLWASGPQNVMGKIQIFDRNTGTLLVSDEVPRSLWNFLTFEPNMALVSSGLHGLTIQSIDGESATPKGLSPFAWATWLMPATVLAFVVWSLLWIRASIRDGGSAWIDALLISSLPFAAIFLRINAVLTQHLTHNLCQGILLGSLVGCAAWVAHGNSRHAFRLMPFFASACLLCVALLLTLGVTPLGVEGLITTALPAAGYLTVALILRLFGCRAVNLDDAKQAKEKPRVGMLDYFALVLGLAIFLAPARQFAAQVNLLDTLRNIWPALLVVSVSLPIYVLLVMSKHRWAFWIAALTTALTAALVVYIPWHHFAFGYYPTSFDAARSIFVVLGLGCVITFAILLPFCARGWRFAFSRRINPSTREP